jgi:hypothetical protein
VLVGLILTYHRTFIQRQLESRGRQRNVELVKSHIEDAPPAVVAETDDLVAMNNSAAPHWGSDLGEAPVLLLCTLLGFSTKAVPD